VIFPLELHNNIIQESLLRPLQRARPWAHYGSNTELTEMAINEMDAEIKGEVNNNNLVNRG